MYILGIGHDVIVSSAAIIKSGNIIAACSEERFNRLKRYREFPHKSLEFCLEEAGISFEEISAITFCWNPGVHMEKFNPLFSSKRRARGEYLYSMPDHLIKHSAYQKIDHIEQVLSMGKNSVSIFFLDHHMCHAANGFFLSPFSKAAILTADGRGEKATTTYCVGEENKIEKIHQVNYPHSLGSFYSTYTEFLGFTPESDEWKVMALASYGKDKGNKYYDIIKKTVAFYSSGDFEIDLTLYNEHNHELPNYYTDKFCRLLGAPRLPDETLKKRHFDIAAAIQKVFEDIIAKKLKWLHKKTGIDNLCVSGGCFMNSVLNGKISRISPFKKVFISSCPDDGGLSIGSALYLHQCIKGEKRVINPQIHNYYGPSFKDGKIKETLKKYRLNNYKHVVNIEAYTAQLLHKEKLVGWFQGRMEFGQRALGNRSILANPTIANMKDRINLAVKYREEFRPFAPAVLDKEASEYFSLPDNCIVPFMEMVCEIKREKRSIIPAVTHVDGTGRPQTVSRKSNPRFYKLIEEFKKLSGIPVLLNTSFNLNGEPVILSPADAIRTFYSSGLDVLVMGNYVVEKEL
ncbi:MAG: carbamoyltransferase [Candidatus Scalinduaceae bacterium]